MIVKKLYRRVKTSGWNKETKEYEFSEITDYIGYFLFGIIPVYLIQLDKLISFGSDGDEKTIRYGIDKKYKNIFKDKYYNKE